MATIKNEHLVWVYADDPDRPGSKLVFLGLTEMGLQYLKNNPGQTLLANPPGTGFANVSQIVMFSAKDKAALKDFFRQAGHVISEVN